MTPHVELFLNTEGSWVDDTLLERFEAVLQNVVADLLAAPPGPDHVLSTLDTVEIAVVDDADIARVHAEFLDDATPTDAITFPYGEILVSCDTAARYAAEHGLDKAEELFRYMVHGLTHLHGYLDYELEDRAAMFAVQEPLVARHFPR